jgi:ABC-type multidrug transport system fused ATPase/permease subunit
MDSLNTQKPASERRNLRPLGAASRKSTCSEGIECAEPVEPAGHGSDLRDGKDCNSTQSPLKLTRMIPEIWKLVRQLRWLLAGSFPLMILNRICGFAMPVASRFLINDVMYKRDLGKLPWILGGVVTATCIQGATTFVLNQQLAIAGQRVIADLRMRVQSHIGRLPIAFYDSNRVGAVAARIMNDVEGVRNLVGAGFLDFAGGILAAIVALAMLLEISPPMTILALTILIAFGWFLKNVFGVTRPLLRKRSEISADVTGRLIESLGGVRVVKGYHAEASEANVFAGGAKRLLDSFIVSITAQSYMSLGSTVAIGLVGGLLMYLGAHEINMNRLDVGSYVEFNMLLAFMIAPIALLVSVGTQLTEAMAGLDRTFELLNESEEGTETGRTNVIGPIRGDVIFKDVTFAYVPGTPVLHGISFHARTGSVTALVGSSGSGKSTIISLVCGFHSPESGQILVDGIDVSTIQLSCYREQLGVVLQETFLFDGSIRDNVLFSRPGATEEQWRHACRVARVDEFADRLPERYKTIIGERGVKLSGGQRQRISIARAILADPRLLILDEATSSLDSESEALIQSGLTSLMQGRTTFVIAHRLSTIRRADQILVIEQGRVVECGSHASLYGLRGRYYDLYTRQYDLDRNLFLAPGEGDKISPVGLAV